VSDVRVVDDCTIDFVTTAPNPLFPDSIANFMILDKGWAESNDAALPARDAENFATMNVNGTGPFSLSSRNPGVRTVLVPYEGWRGEAEHKVTEAVFSPSATRSQALRRYCLARSTLSSRSHCRTWHRLKGGMDSRCSKAKKPV
jgi:peptide/nickel transport system substrate-binding protein